MRLIIEMILGTLIALLVYNLVHHFFVIIPNQKRVSKIKNHVDLILKNAINNLDYDDPVSSHGLSNIWGRGILVFEYVFDVRLKNDFSLNTFQKELTYELNRHSKIKNVKYFIITDSFQYDGYVHIDIAYLINQSTKDYVKDLGKLK